jgi:hypothetical protein
MAKVDFSKMTREEGDAYLRAKEDKINRQDEFILYRIGPVILTLAALAFIFAHIIPAFVGR